MNRRENRDPLRTETCPCADGRIHLGPPLAAARGRERQTARRPMNEETGDGPSGATARPRPGRLKLVVAFAIIYFVWGSTYIAIRFGIETLPPFTMAGTRFLLAGLILYAACRVTGVAAPKAHHWKPAFVLGLLMPVLI